MEWYQDQTRKTYVVTYRNEKEMRTQLELAAHYGFVSQAMTRKGQEWTVTFHRDERTWARLQVEQALAQVHQEQAKLQQTEDRIAGLQNALQSSFRAARTQTSNPTELEKKLHKSITDLIAARNAANAQRLLVLNAYTSLSARRAEAAKLQVEVPQADINVEAESAPIRSESAREGQRLEREQALQQTQQQVLKAVQEWQKVVGDWWGANTRVAKIESKVAGARTSTTTVDTQVPAADNSKARAAEVELTKHRTKAEALETLLQQREADLLLYLEARDRDVAAVIG